MAKRGQTARRDGFRFLRAWARRPGVTGAVAPSGRALARRMAGFVDPAADGLVVELGPGTGPVTEALLARGVPASRLVLIEFNPAFAALLRARFPGVAVIEGDGYALAATLGPHAAEPVSAVVSSLPLLNRPLHERKALVLQALALLAPGAPLIQFSYGLAAPVKAEPSLFRLDVTPWVFANIPPARVWTYRRNSADDPVFPRWV